MKRLIRVAALCSLVACEPSFLGGPLYAFCESDWLCPCGEEVCHRCIAVRVDVEPPTHGQFCSRHCFSDEGCPQGVCVRWDGDADGYCYQTCDSAADCFPSSQCADIFVERRELRVCLPNRLPESTE
ncbi:MAG: hypothetical protein KF901_19325 [Myxococcales bacterium]|nr:hypothetical protein [Myxococcales bacterium]